MFNKTKDVTVADIEKALAPLTKIAGVLDGIASRGGANLVEIDKEMDELATRAANQRLVIDKAVKASNKFKEVFGEE